MALAYKEPHPIASGNSNSRISVRTRSPLETPEMLAHELLLEMAQNDILHAATWLMPIVLSVLAIREALTSSTPESHQKLALGIASLVLVFVAKLVSFAVSWCVGFCNDDPDGSGTNGTSYNYVLQIVNTVACLCSIVAYVTL